MRGRFLLSVDLKRPSVHSIKRWRGVVHKHETPRKEYHYVFEIYKDSSVKTHTVKRENLTQKEVGYV